MAGQSDGLRHPGQGVGHVNATSSGGGDVAALYDSSGNDTYTSNSSGSRLAGTGYSCMRPAFRSLRPALLRRHGHCQPVAQHDHHQLRLRQGQRHGQLLRFQRRRTFYGVPQSSYSIMLGANYYNEAIGFGTTAASPAGGKDTALSTTPPATIRTPRRTTSARWSARLLDAGHRVCHERCFLLQRS